MVTWDELIAYWGRDGLRRLSAGALQGIAIPQLAQQFLADVGLPRNLRAANQALGFAFDCENGVLEKLSEFSPTLAQWMPAKSFLRLGTSFDAHVCIREPDGVVFIVSEGDGFSADFLNTGIQELVTFVYLYEKCTGIGKGVSGEKLEMIIQQTKAQFRENDPSVFENSENWWSVVLEDMRY